MLHVCSSYKFFGPYAGALYGKYDLLNELKAYKVRPASDELPYKFETGTQNHEGIAGVLGALEYFEWLGNEFGDSNQQTWKEAGFLGRRLVFKQAMSAIQDYGMEMSKALIQVIESVPGTRIHGVTDLDRLEERVPTVSFTLKGGEPGKIANAFGKEGFYIWNGHNYALSIVQRMGLLEADGMVCVGPVHYNTLEEIERFGLALKKVASKQQKGPVISRLVLLCFVSLNDEHQGEGGTLVFVGANITTMCF
ncbi:MAG TPA: aminotransferase class V-fold PLP-dependent enzyme [Anaerolineales bacterium]